MKIKTIYQHSLFSFAMVAGLLMATPAQAQFTPGTVLYETNFNGENNSVPADWGRYYGDGNRMDINNNRFYWRREPTGNSAGFFGWYEGSYSGVASSEWADYRVETVFRSGKFDSSGNRNGIILRWQDDSGPASNNQGYLGTVNTAGEGFVRLAIIKDFSNGSKQTGDAGGTLLSEQTFSFDWVNNAFYNFSFEASGDLLTLVFSNTAQTESISLSTTDSTYSTGAPGMRVYLGYGGSGWQTEWDSMSVVAVGSPIPEPATVGILMGAVSLMSVYLIRRSRR